MLANDEEGESDEEGDFVCEEVKEEDRGEDATFCAKCGDVGRMGEFGFDFAENFSSRFATLIGFEGDVGGSSVFGGSFHVSSQASSSFEFVVGST